MREGYIKGKLHLWVSYNINGAVFRKRDKNSTYIRINLDLGIYTEGIIETKHIYSKRKCDKG